MSTTVKLRHVSGHDGSRSSAGAGSAGRWGLFVTTLYLMVVGVLAAYTLVSFWPKSDTGEHHYRFLWVHLPIQRENDLFLVVAMAGIVGSTIYAMRSFFRYAGERKLLRSWLFQYYLAPLVGGGLGLVFYLVVRGGLLSTNASSNDTNAFGVAALAALGGLFVQQALEKLKEIFEAIFTKSAPGSDHITDTAPVCDGVDPNHGGPGDSVTIRGAGLDHVTQVSFGGSGAVASSTVDPSALTVTVPDDAATGPLTLTYDGKDLTTTCVWTLDPSGPPLPPQEPMA